MGQAYVRPHSQSRALTPSEVAQLEKLGPDAFLARVAPIWSQSEPTFL